MEKCFEMRSRALPQPALAAVATRVLDSLHATRLRLRRRSWSPPRRIGRP